MRGCPMNEVKITAATPTTEPMITDLRRFAAATRGTVGITSTAGSKSVVEKFAESDVGVAARRRDAGEKAYEGENRRRVHVFVNEPAERQTRDEE